MLFPRLWAARLSEASREWHHQSILTNALENDDVYVPSAEIIQELKDYIVNDQGKAEAAAGCHDDYVMSFAIALEVLRSHYDRITTNKVPWNQKFTDIEQDDTRWI